jgi:phospholipase/carboxylesterase
MAWARILLAVAVVLSPARSGRAQTSAHLQARPSAATGRAAPGLTALGLSANRDAYLYVPKGYRSNHPAPLLVLLHGATQSADLWTRSATLFSLADSMGLVLLMPNSEGRTWDLMMDGFGPDVARLDSALTLVFRRCNIDPKHIALGGFSDGATYALSLGVGNGDLFSWLIAFSPGYLAPVERHGTPRIFIAHGTDDRILPINSASRRIVPMLKQAGYTVVYHEFEGPHTVRPDQLQQALAWFLEP